MNARDDTMTAAELAVSTPKVLQVRGSEDPLDLAWPAVIEGAVLCINLDITAGGEALMNAAWPHASPGERSRALRFLDRRDAVRHLAARAALRLLLSRQLGGKPVVGEFVANAWGKPELPGSGLEFSISHSGDDVWLALTRDGPVGIDVEQATKDIPFRDLARTFHPDEAADIRNCAESELWSTFFRCWTRKESVIKAAGRGLSIPLDSFVVDTGATCHDWLRQPPGGSARREWTTADLPVRGGYRGAVAAKGAMRFSAWRHGFENG